MAEIAGQGISFSYDADGGCKLTLDGIDISIRKGELVALFGANGCGKSTLVKHFNAILPLQKGSLSVAGLDVRDDADLWKLRRLCGMVFQNPDNQFVSSVVEEDIAFGLENYGVSREEIPQRVREALKLVDMEGYEKRAPHTLSGGQKQRVALAGVLALSPEIIIFDEATAMLDPDGRQEILGLIRRLRDAGKTLVMITHYIEEAVFADIVYLMHGGKMLGRGAPRDVLTNPELMAQAGLLPPVPVRLYHDLKVEGIDLGVCPLTHEELVDAICRLN